MLRKVICFCLLEVFVGVINGEEFVFGKLYVVDVIKVDRFDLERNF